MSCLSTPGNHESLLEPEVAPTVDSWMKGLWWCTGVSSMIITVGTPLQAGSAPLKIALHAFDTHVVSAHDGDKLMYVLSILTFYTFDANEVVLGG